MNAVKNIVKAMSVVLIAASIANAGPSPKDTAKLSAAPKGSLTAAKVQETTLLTVSVIDSNGQQVEGLLVEIDSRLGRVPHAESYTDPKGHAYFKNLLADDYRIVVHTESGFVWAIATVKGKNMEVVMKVPAAEIPEGEGTAKAEATLKINNEPSEEEGTAKAEAHLVIKK